nr:type IV secretory system conjugative DNA transfer family protein [Holdemanella biformis]
MNGRPKNPKFARNKNVIVIGGSGSGKTRFYVKPNLMQMGKYISYVVTDPKGTIIIECGKMLVRHGYKVKVLNTINFSKSMHYNPFHYIHSEKDILKLVNTIMVNTKGEGEKSSEDFWTKAERLLYCALIGYIWYEAPEEEQNFATLLEFINASETREDDETFKNAVDMLFEELEKEEPEHFAVRQYKKYKLAAGKTAKSILISCGARLKQVFNAVIATTIPRLAYLRKNDVKAFENLAKRILSIASICTIPAAVGLIILRKEVITLISGNNYLESAPTLAILSAAIFFGILANILANGVLICMGREKCVVKATVVSAAGNAALNFVFIPFLSQNGAAITTLLAEMTVFGMSLYYSRDVVMHMIDFSEFRNAILGSALMLLVSFPVSKVLANSHLLIKITIMMGVCAGVYVIVLILFRDKVLFSIFEQTKRKLSKQK